VTGTKYSRVSESCSSIADSRAHLYGTNFKLKYSSLQRSSVFEAGASYGGSLFKLNRSVWQVWKGGKPANVEH
jgi:hypothetical protein